MEMNEQVFEEDLDSVLSMFFPNAESDEELDEELDDWAND